MVKLRKIIIFIYVVVVVLGPGSLLIKAQPVKAAVTVAPKATWIDSQTIRITNLQDWSKYKDAKYFDWSGYLNGTIDSDSGVADFKYTEQLAFGRRAIVGGGDDGYVGLALYTYKSKSGCVNTIWVSTWADGANFARSTTGGITYQNIPAKFDKLNLPARWLPGDTAGYLDTLQGSNLDRFDGIDSPLGFAILIPNPKIGNGQCVYSGKGYPTDSGVQGDGDIKYLDDLWKTPHVELPVSNAWNSLASVFLDTDKDVLWHKWGKDWASFAPMVMKKQNIAGVTRYADQKNRLTLSPVYNANCNDNTQRAHIDIEGTTNGLKKGTFFLYTQIGDSDPTCKEIKFHAYIMNRPLPDDLDLTGGDGVGEETPEKICYTSVTAFRYIFCPMIITANEVAGRMRDSVEGLLKISPLAKGSEIRPVWEQMRNLANVFFVLVFLVIIFSNIFSFGLSNYSIKKTLPRLVVAAILVQFSFLICGIAVDIGNVAGEGVASLIAVKIQAPPGTMVPSLLSYTIGTITAGLVVGVVLAAALPMALFAVIAAILSIIGVIITLLFRRFFIILLIVLSPIAFLAWILPGTQNIFKKFWLNNFIKLILMYPLIALILGMGSLVQAAALADKAGDLAQLAASLYPTIALFMIPATFKMSGGIMSKASGAINGKFKSWGKSAKGSQLAKDMKAQNKESGLKKTASDSRAIRAWGRMQSGTKLGAIPGIGRNTERRRVSALNKHLEERGKEYAAQFAEEDISPAALKTIAMGGDAWEEEKEDGTKVLHEADKRGKDIAGQMAAIQALTARRDIKKLQDIQAKNTTAKGETTLWKMAKQANYETLSKVAPHIVRGTAAFDSFSAEQLSNFHKDTLAAMIEHVEGPGKGTQLGYAKKAARSVLDDTRLSSKISPDVRKILEDFSPEPKKTPGFTYKAGEASTQRPDQETEL